MFTEDIHSLKQIMSLRPDIRKKFNDIECLANFLKNHKFKVIEGPGPDIYYIADKKFSFQPKYAD